MDFGVDFEPMLFKLHSDYKPTGDQPQAIEALVKGFKEGNQFQTLLGVTGLGKTFTMTNIIAVLNKAHFGNCAQQDPRQTIIWRG